MSITFNKEKASDLTRRLAANLADSLLDSNWLEKIEKVSILCENNVSKTHIAFLGTALLAKSLNSSVDLLAIKPKHSSNNPNSFSARSLCHGVLVPMSAEIGFSLGVTGREPLNNQPYFRMTRLDDNTPVHPGSRAAFDYMIELIGELKSMDVQSSQNAFKVFIAIRQNYMPRYVDIDTEYSVSTDHLKTMISELVGENSEGGKRAQACAAGLYDVFAGPDRVESGRINDPSRKHPGDVCVLSSSETLDYEKAVEIRDKPVVISDVQIFGKKCLDMGVQDAAVLMVNNNQSQLDEIAISEWSHRFGIGITLFYGWPAFVDQALYWSSLPKPIAANTAVQYIRDRLVGVEASAEAVELWKKYIHSNDA